MVAKLGVEHELKVLGNQSSGDGRENLGLLATATELCELRVGLQCITELRDVANICGDLSVRWDGFQVCLATIACSSGSGYQVEKGFREGMDAHLLARQASAGVSIDLFKQFDELFLGRVRRTGSVTSKCGRRHIYGSALAKRAARLFGTRVCLSANELLQLQTQHENGAQGKRC